MPAQSTQENRLVERWRNFLERAAEFRDSNGKCFDSVRLAHGFFLDEMRRVERDVAQSGNSRLRELNQEAMFAMAALVDEFARTRLSSKEDKDYWYARELAKEFFHTADAGSEFYARTHTLLKRVQADEAEVRILYFRALALGFRGERAGQEASRALDEAKSLLRSVDRDLARLRLTANAYEHVHQGKDPRLGSRWATFALVGVATLVFGAGLFVYFRVTGDLKNLNSRLSELSGSQR